jgi:hypothetical protein
MNYQLVFNIGTKLTWFVDVGWEWEWEEDGKMQGCTRGWHPYLVASQCDSKQIWYPCDTVIPRLRVRYSRGSEFPRPYPYPPYPRPKHRGYSHTRDEPYAIVATADDAQWHLHVCIRKTHTNFKFVLYSCPNIQLRSNIELRLHKDDSVVKTKVFPPFHWVFWRKRKRKKGEREILW